LLGCGKHELSEILVFCQQETPLRSREFDYLLVINAGHQLRDRDDIVSGAANADDHGKVATLVGNQAHYCGCRSLSRPR
jgi:hypothetical protein